MSLQQGTCDYLSQKDEKQNTTGLDDTPMLHINIKITKKAQYCTAIL